MVDGETIVFIYPWTIDCRLFSLDLVSNLLNDDGSWNWDRIHMSLPPFIWGKVLSVPRGTEDVIVSPYMLNGKISVKAICDGLACGDDHRAEHIGKPGKFIPNRRIWWFVWRILGDKLQTKEALQRRNVIADNICSSCTTEVEDLSHLFLSCDLARAFWHAFSIRFQWEPGTRNLTQMKNLLCWNAKGDVWRAASQCMLAIGLWNIWNLRNSLLFEDRVDNVNFLIEAAVSRARIQFVECWTLKRFVSLKCSWEFHSWIQSVEVINNRGYLV